MLKLSNGTVWSYDPSLFSWTKLADAWYAEGSDAWQGRSRANAQLSNRGIVSALEGGAAEFARPPDAEKARPAWWGAALTLGHLETRMHAAKALDSSQEYKHALSVYARKIADEGFRAKGEELVKELFGPTYWLARSSFRPPSLILMRFTRRPGRDDTWSPTVLGFSKRDLLRDVLGIFGQYQLSVLRCHANHNPPARSKTLTKLALDWQDILKRASNED